MGTTQQIIDDITSANQADLDAAMLPHIEFEKIKRDCPYNNEARKERKKLIKDIKILINGEYRAIAMSEGRSGFGKHESMRRAYTLKDIDGRAIYLKHNDWNRPHRGEPIGDQGQLLPIIKEALKLDLIPDAAQLEALRIADAAKKQAETDEVPREKQIIGFIKLLRLS